LYLSFEDTLRVPLFVDADGHVHAGLEVVARDKRWPPR